jgi:hypothetical protein
LPAVRTVLRVIGWVLLACVVLATVTVYWASAGGVR